MCHPAPARLITYNNSEVSNLTIIWETFETWNIVGLEFTLHCPVQPIKKANAHEFNPNGSTLNIYRESIKNFINHLGH